MIAEQTTITVEQLETRLTELEQEHAALRAENARLQQDLAALRSDRPMQGLSRAMPAARTMSSRTSRRAMLTTVLGAAAATVGAGALMETQTGVARAAASEGQTVFTSNTTNATVEVHNSDTSVNHFGPGLYTTSIDGNAIEGVAGGSIFAAIQAQNTGGGAAIHAFAGGATPSGTIAAAGVIAEGGTGYGVYSSGGAYGVYGTSTSGKGVAGTSSSGDGLYGSSASGSGVHAFVTGSGQIAVLAEGGAGTGVQASGGASGGVGVAASGDIGVLGASTNSGTGNTSAGVGVKGTTTVPTGYGVLGDASVGGGTGVWGKGGTGVTGISNSSGGVGVSGNGQTGVLGQSSSGPGVEGDTGSGPGVKGTSASGAGVTGASATGPGGSFTSASGIGVSAATASSASGARAVLGTVTSATPGANTAAVLGQNNGTNNNGFGVWGIHNGGGPGVQGNSSQGNGVVGLGHGNGVVGIGQGNGVVGLSQNNGAGVRAASTGGSGLLATSTSGAGVTGISTNGLGASFQGGLAPLRLVAAAIAGHPTTGTHSLGELFLDKNGALWICVAGGTPGTWKQVVVQ
jgi:hypothetical protein